jgi:hypothetical protein
MQCSLQSPVSLGSYFVVATPLVTLVTPFHVDTNIVQLFQWQIAQRIDGPSQTASGHWPTIAGDQRVTNTSVANLCSSVPYQSRMRPLEHSKRNKLPTAFCGVSTRLTTENSYPKGEGAYYIIISHLLSPLSHFPGCRTQPWDWEGGLFPDIFLTISTPYKKERQEKLRYSEGGKSRHHKLSTLLTIMP